MPNPRQKTDPDHGPDENPANTVAADTFAEDTATGGSDRPERSPDTNPAIRAAQESYNEAEERNRAFPPLAIDLES